MGGLDGAFSLSNINISDTSGSIAIKFNLNHHQGEKKAASKLQADWIGILDSMATGTCSCLRV